MKELIEQLIREYELLVCDHHDMNCSGVCDTIKKLKARLIHLLNSFDTVDPDSEEWGELDALLDKANDAYKAAEDAVESHCGGNTTQI
jgi:hypothetical protein